MSDAAPDAASRARVMRSTSSATAVSTAVADPADLARLGVLVRLLRMERSAVSELARRAMCARSTVQRLEAGRLHPRPSLLGWVAYGLDPDNAKLIREALIIMAGGREALADDGGWGRHRARQGNNAMFAGKVPLPSDLRQRIGLHQQASACWWKAQRILDRPGALDDPRALDIALKLMDQSRELRAAAGGMISIGWGSRRVTYGIGL
jgi:hypothetical protein